MSTSAPPDPRTRGLLLARLRAETRDLHTEAERHPVQAELVQGKVGRAAYAAYLRLMHYVHTVLERALEANSGHPLLAPVGPEQFRAGLIVQDLATLGEGSEAGVQPDEALSAFAAAVAGSGAPELLGMQYVLEGSTNGGRFLAAAVARSLGLASGCGTTYLDPYGAEQRARWGEFCTSLEALELTGTERDRVVAGASVMFRGLVGMFDQMLRPGKDTE